MLKFYHNAQSEAAGNYSPSLVRIKTAAAASYRQPILHTCRCRDCPKRRGPPAVQETTGFFREVSAQVFASDVPLPFRFYGRDILFRLISRSSCRSQGSKSFRLVIMGISQPIAAFLPCACCRSAGLIFNVVPAPIWTGKL